LPGPRDRHHEGRDDAAQGVDGVTIAPLALVAAWSPPAVEIKPTTLPSK
jgi:hypothetical protein